MKTILTAAFASLILAAPVAAGDPALGEKDFAKCRACHLIADGDTVIQKGGKTGPNLFGVVGRAAGTQEGFAYSKGMQEVAAKGVIWDEAMIAVYVTDPTGWLEETSGDPAAKSKMTFKLKDGANVAAYLASLTPPAN